MERELGGVGTRVLFENERVRVWEMRLAPGESSAVHQHALDYLLVFLAGDRIRVAPEPDTAGPYRDELEFDVPIGHTVFVERGGIETAVNVGRREYREILIELKDEHAGGGTGHNA